MGTDDQQNAGDDGSLSSAAHKSGSTRTGGGAAAGVFLSYCPQFTEPDNLVAGSAT